MEFGSTAPNPEEAQFEESARAILSDRTVGLIEAGRTVLDITDPSGAIAMWFAAGRLRAAVEFFRPALQGTDYRGTRDEIRSLARVIGQRADLDAAVRLIEQVGAEMDESGAVALEDLIESVDARRAAVNRELATIVHGRRLQSLKVRLEGLAGEALGPRDAAAGPPPAPESLPPKAIRTVSRRLATLRARMPRAIESDEARVHQRAGNAAARLRYSLELSGEALGGQAHTARRAARGIQEILLEIRRSDVTLPMVVDQRETITRRDVETVLERSRGIRELDPILVQAVPNRNGYRALSLTEVHLEARRRMKRESLKRLWLEQARQGVWVALEATLSDR